MVHKAVTILPALSIGPSTKYEYLGSVLAVTWQILIIGIRLSMSARPCCVAALYVAHPEREVVPSL